MQANAGGSPPISMPPSSRAVGDPVSASSPLVTASDWDVPAPAPSTSSGPTGSLAPGGIAGPLDPQVCKPLIFWTVTVEQLQEYGAFLNVWCTAGTAALSM